MMSKHLTGSALNLCGTDGIALPCPACGSTALHISEVLIATAAQRIEVIGGPDCYDDPTGRVIGAEHYSEGDPTLRGAEVRVAMFCEAGHTFTLVLWFHEGRVFAREDRGPTMPAAALTDLWRD